MKELDPLLHNRLRLAIMALLTQNEQLSFTEIVEKTGSTRGNVSVQLSQLEEAGYLEIEKKFHKKKPLTVVKITSKGHTAMHEYALALKEYLNI